MSRENCFENVVSDLTKISLSVHKTTFRKKNEKKEEEKMKTFPIFGGFWGKTSSSGGFLRPLSGHCRRRLAASAFFLSVLVHYTFEGYWFKITSFVQKSQALKIGSFAKKFRQFF